MYAFWLVVCFIMLSKKYLLCKIICLAALRNWPPVQHLCLHVDGAGAKAPSRIYEGKVVISSLSKKDLIIPGSIQVYLKHCLIGNTKFCQRAHCFLTHSDFVIISYNVIMLVYCTLVHNYTCMLFTSAVFRTFCINSLPDFGCYCVRKNKKQ